MDRTESITQFEQYLKRRFPGRRTAIDYVSDVRLFAAFCAKPWRDVTIHDIDAFVDHQRTAGRSQATIKRRVAALKTFFDFLAEDSGDLTWPNPVRFKRHAGKQPKPLPRALSDQAVDQVWRTIDSARDRAWFVLMWRAGLRVGEVVQLQVPLDLTPPQVDQPARLRVMGKGQKERLVLLSADAYDVLNAWLQQRPATDQPHVFLNAHGQPLTANGLQWLLHGYGQQVGLSVTPHQLRHTFARQLTEAGLPIASLGQLMGHAHLSTTQLYTAGADPAVRQAYQDAMTRLNPPPVAPAPSPAPSAPASTDTPPALPLISPASPTPHAPLPLPPPPDLPNWDDWLPELPAELRQASLAHVQRSLATCKPHRQHHKAVYILSRLARLWTWFLAQHPITSLADLHLADLQAYQTARLAQGRAPATINRDLNYISAILHEQADAGRPVDASVFRLRRLPLPDRLPRHLSEPLSQQLEAFVRQRLATPDPRLRLENACFFVLAHTGLRASECVDLLYQDLDLPAQRLLVRLGKGQRDRLVYLSNTATHALRLYLSDTSRQPTDPLWTLPSGSPITNTWLAASIVTLGQAAGVGHVTPHRLRHTLATRLLNAGMDITHIQKLLGHEHINTTLIYAHVLDATLEANYRQAMSRIETQQPPLSNTPIPANDWPTTTLTEPVSQVVQSPLDNSV
jgi:site-specific recombinase XerD